MMTGSRFFLGENPTCNLPLSASFSSWTFYFFRTHQISILSDITPS
jgi:hypothetical protein